MSAISYEAFLYLPPSRPRRNIAIAEIVVYGLILCVAGPIRFRQLWWYWKLNRARHPARVFLLSTHFNLLFLFCESELPYLPARPVILDDV